MVGRKSVLQNYCNRRTGGGGPPGTVGIVAACSPSAGTPSLADSDTSGTAGFIRESSDEKVPSFDGYVLSISAGGCVMLPIALLNSALSYISMRLRDGIN